MGLLDAADVPVQPTLEQIVNGLKARNARLYRELVKEHTDIFNEVWFNQFYTPSQIIGGFGTDAKALFVLSASIQGVLAGANPEYKPLTPTQPVTLNDDGTVTIGD